MEGVGQQGAGECIALVGVVQGLVLGVGAQQRLHLGGVLAGGGIGLDGGEAVAVGPDATSLHLGRKLGEDVHALGGLTADHVLDGRERAQAVVEQKVFGGAEQVGIAVGVADVLNELALHQQTTEGIGETQRCVDGQGGVNGTSRQLGATEGEQCGQPVTAGVGVVDGDAQVAAPGLAENGALAVEDHQGIAACTVLVAVPAADVPTNEEVGGVPCPSAHITRFPTIYCPHIVFLVSDKDVSLKVIFWYVGISQMH